MRLNKKIAMVTGAARGMGRTTAELFAREGAKVIVADIHEQDANAVVSAISAGGNDAVFLQLDVAKESDWSAAMRAAIERYGRLDILVNNAGVSGSVSDLNSIADFDRLMSFKAPARISACSMPPLRRGGRAAGRS